MKLPKSLTKPISLITIVIVVILVILAGVGFWLNLNQSMGRTDMVGTYDRPDDQQIDYKEGEMVDISKLDEAPGSPAITTTDVDNWKEYKDPSKKFMINFPQSWKVSFEQNKTFKDKTDVNIEGPEGWVSLMWSDSFGGACPDGKKKIIIKSGEEEFCHIPNLVSEGKQNNTEYWTFQKRFTQKEPQGIYLNAYAYNKESGKEFTNQEILLKVIQSFNIAP